MLQILRDVLNQTTGPEFVAMIDEAHDQLDQYELEDFTLEFEDMLGDAGNQDAGSLTEAVYRLTRVFQIQVLNQHLIKVNDEATVAQISMILDNLRQIEKTEFISEIISIADNEVDPVQALVEIFGIISGRSPEEFFPLIEYVEGSLIKRILETTNRRYEVESLNVVDHETVNAVVKQYKDFLEGVQRAQPPLVQTYIELGAHVGESLASYCKYIQENNVSTNPADIATEYVAAALLAGDVPKLPRDAIIVELNKVYSSIDVITPILISVDKQLLDMQIRLNSGVKKVQA